MPKSFSLDYENSNLKNKVISISLNMSSDNVHCYIHDYSRGQICPNYLGFCGKIRLAFSNVHLLEDNSLEILSLVYSKSKPISIFF